MAHPNNPIRSSETLPYKVELISQFSYDIGVPYEQLDRTPITHPAHHILQHHPPVHARQTQIQGENGTHTIYWEAICPPAYPTVTGQKFALVPDDSRSLPTIAKIGEIYCKDDQTISYRLVIHPDYRTEVADHILTTLKCWNEGAIPWYTQLSRWVLGLRAAAEGRGPAHDICPSCEREHCTHLHTIYREQQLNPYIRKPYFMLE